MFLAKGKYYFIKQSKLQFLSIVKNQEGNQHNTKTCKVITWKLRKSE